APRPLRGDPNRQRRAADRDRAAALLRPDLVAEHRLQPRPRGGRIALARTALFGAAMPAKSSTFVPTLTLTSAQIGARLACRGRWEGAPPNRGSGLRARVN